MSKINDTRKFLQLQRTRYQDSELLKSHKRFLKKGIDSEYAEELWLDLIAEMESRDLEYDL